MQPNMTRGLWMNVIVMSITKLWNMNFGRSTWSARTLSGPPLHALLYEYYIAKQGRKTPSGWVLMPKDKGGKPQGRSPGSQRSHSFLVLLLSFSEPFIQEFQVWRLIISDHGSRKEHHTFILCHILAVRTVYFKRLIAMQRDHFKSPMFENIQKNSTTSPRNLGGRGPSKSFKLKGSAILSSIRDCGKLANPCTIGLHSNHLWSSKDKLFSFCGSVLRPEIAKMI